jgi:hypothetical protein
MPQRKTGQNKPQSWLYSKNRQDNPNYKIFTHICDQNRGACNTVSYVHETVV